MQPLADLASSPPSLDPINLPAYAGADHAAHAGRDGRVAPVHVHLRDVGGQEPSRRARAPAAPRHPPVGADPGLPLGHRRVLHVAGARAGPGRRMRGRVRDLHQSGLEHGLQLLPVPPDGPRRADRGVPLLPRHALGALLASRRAVRHAGARLEHDDVDVRRLVLRRGLGGDQCRGHDGHAARDRLLHRARHRPASPRRHRLGDRRHADRHSPLRPAALPAARRLGRSVSVRAGGGRRGAALLGAHGAPPIRSRRDAVRARGRGLAPILPAAAAPGVLDAAPDPRRRGTLGRPDLDRRRPDPRRCSHSG